MKHLRLFEEFQNFIGRDCIIRRDFVIKPICTGKIISISKDKKFYKTDCFDGWFSIKTNTLKGSHKGGTYCELLS